MSIGRGDNDYGDAPEGVAGTGAGGRGRPRARAAEDDVVDAYDDGAARPPVRMGRSAVTVMGVVVLLIAAIAFANRSGGSGSAGADGTRADGARPTAPTGERPVARSGGVPDGFPHTAQGAQSAAANYAVALGGSGMFDAEERHRIVDAVYTPEAAAGLKESLDRVYSPSFLERLGLDADGDPRGGGTFVSRTIPVGTTVTEYGGDGATVEVWYTALIGTAGPDSTHPVTTTWKTWTFELRWTGSDWRVADDSQRDGPAPVPGDLRASTAEDISKAVEEYGGFTYAR